MYTFLYDFMNIKKIVEGYNQIVHVDCLGKKGSLTGWGYK